MEDYVNVRVSSRLLFLPVRLIVIIEADFDDVSIIVAVHGHSRRLRG